jgi:hypothetical protein
LALRSCSPYTNWQRQRRRRASIQNQSESPLGSLTPLTSSDCGVPAVLVARENRRQGRVSSSGLFDCGVCGASRGLGLVTNAGLGLGTGMSELVTASSWIGHSRALDCRSRISILRRSRISPGVPSRAKVSSVFHELRAGKWYDLVALKQFALAEMAPRLEAWCLLTTLGLVWPALCRW